MTANQVRFRVRVPALIGACLIWLPSALAQVPQSNHVFVVVLENHSYLSVIGSSSMPYLNSLAKKYGLATNYYANTHPSIGNYFVMTTGQVITNNDSYSNVVTADNIVRHFSSAAKTWESYAESLPSVGYTGGDTGLYMKHHNPFAYFSDVVNSSMEKLNLVPFSKFGSDLANHQLPNYSFIIPNKCNDAHDCSLGTADSWLKWNIAPLIASSTFQQSGLLVILFDESFSSDTAHGGGHIAAVVISPKSRPGYRSTTFYQHQSLLKLMMKALGLKSFPGASSTAPDMGEFFTTAPATCAMPSTTTSENLCSPVSGSTVSSPVHVVAKGGSAVDIMEAWIDGVKRNQVSGNSLDFFIALSSGSHQLTVFAKHGGVVKDKKTATFTVH